MGNNMFMAIFSACLFTLTMPAAAIDTAQHPSPSPRPNILLIMVDDMGFADLGSFGSEIATPNLDALATQGIRLSNFITSSVCSPTRASVLTGVTAHKAGFGNLAEELAPNQQGQPGYEGYLNERVVTIATLMRDAGYRTYMTGKWHLGERQGSTPAERGFDRSFAMMKNASHFADMTPAYSPDPKTKADYREDGQQLTALPATFSYSSQFFVDRLIDYVREGDSQRPFFAYLAFSAPHWPLQAPDTSIAKFKGQYDAGYDVITEQRFLRQKHLGLLPAAAQLPQRPPKTPHWQALSADQQQRYSRAMEVYAAMIAEIDQHSGRLFDYLRASGQFDNTVIIFMSDNGPEGHDLDETWPAAAYPEIRRVIDERFDFTTANMGRPGSYTFYGAGWAQASSPGFHLHKGFASEGGVRTVAFIYARHGFDGSRIENALVTSRDIAPTILDIANVQHPGKTYAHRPIEPITGMSVVPLLRHESESESESESAARIHVDETIGKVSARKGDWKITRMPDPYGNGDWQLFNLRTDVGERQNLAAEYPDKVKELVQGWKAYQADNRVILPDWLSGY